MRKIPKEQGWHYTGYILEFDPQSMGLLDIHRLCSFFFFFFLHIYLGREFGDQLRSLAPSAVIAPVLPPSEEVLPLDFRGYKKIHQKNLRLHSLPILPCFQIPVAPGYYLNLLFS